MTTTTTASRRVRRAAPPTSGFPTRSYDLVKEFVVSLAVVTALSLALAGIFSSPDDPAISLRTWAQKAPADVVATASAELGGTSASATYGPPYNHAAEGQKLLGIPLQKWGGVRLPVDSAALVTGPLSGAAAASPLVGRALALWNAASPQRRAAWANAYSDQLAKAPGGNPVAVRPGPYGPVPIMAAAFLAITRAGGVEGQLTSSGTFYGTDQTRPLLLLSDGAFLENQARALRLGGDQWGMMNETGNYPGQPWMWLYTFWYQVKPFSTSENADALVWGLMLLLTLALMFLPLIPGLRDIPRWIPVHRLIWRGYYRSQVPHQRTGA